MQTEIEKQSTTTKHQDEPLTPQTILTTIQITHPKGLLTVEGVVIRMTEYPKDFPKVVYGELRDELGDNVIQFKCPINRSPHQVGEVAVIRGSLSFISRTKKESAIRITGDCVSRRKPIEKFHHPIQSKSIQAKIRLDEFIGKHGLDALLIIGTPIAVKDIHSGILNSFQRDCQLNTQPGNFNSPAELLDTARKALVNGCRGILFARGGNDTDTLQHWDNIAFINQLEELKCPIYTAIGHSNQLFLVEKYVSDDFFITPTAAGHAIGSALKDRNAKSQLFAKLTNMQKDLEASQSASSQLNVVKKRFTYALIVIAVLLVALWLK